MANPFDDKFSSTISVLGILLIIAGALSFFGVNIPVLGKITAWILAIGGLLAFLNSFRIWGNMNAGASIVMLILTLAITLAGINAVYVIPLLSKFIAYLPINSIVIAVMGIILIIDAGMSTT
jgi:hypothetical protein